MTPWTPEVAQELQRVTGETLRPGGLEITEQALRFCNFPKHSLILDAGCGTGSTTRYLTDRCEATAFGIDLSAPLLDEARLQRGHMPLIRGNLESLPFGEETLDGVTCECVLSVTSIPQVLEEVSRVLRTGGFLILSDLYRRNPGVTEMMEGSRDPGLPGKDQLIAMLENLRFETLHWEDRTADLKKLAARLIMKGVSFDEILAPTDQTNFPCGKRRKDAWRELGYCLLIARKTIAPRRVHEE
jgi:SAM-dependent methyltransferase